MIFGAKALRVQTFQWAAVIAREATAYRGNPVRLGSVEEIQKQSTLAIGKPSIDCFVAVASLAMTVGNQCSPVSGS